MRVRCISDSLTEEQREGISGITMKPPLWVDNITVGKEYTVLGISFGYKVEYMNGVTLDLCSDVGMITTVPMRIFEIVDNRSSKFWRAEIKGNYFILQPPEFFQEFFYDMLTDDLPEEVAIFRSVVKYMEAEFVEEDNE